EPTTVGVCMAQGFNVVNCATSVEFDPPELFMARGATASPPHPAGRDANDQPTALPADLVYESSDPSVAAVPTNGAQVIAGLFGLDLPVSAEIKAQSPATGAEGSYRVHIVEP